MTRIGIKAVGDDYILTDDGVRESWEADAPLRVLAQEAVARHDRQVRESAIWQDGLKAGAVFASVAWVVVLVLIWAVMR